MRIAACQTEAIRHNVEEAVTVLRRFALEADRKAADVVLFPEGFLQGYFADRLTVAQLAVSLESAEFRTVLDVLRDIQCVVVFGVLERDADDFYNTAVVVRSGEVVCKYRKTHLLEGEKDAFTPGSMCPVFEVAGQKVGLNICFDLNFPTATAAVVEQGASILLCPCNNMMPLRKAEKYKRLHNKIRAERAKESSVWIVSSDVTGSWGERISYGPTAAINPDGEVVAQVPLLETGMILVDVDCEGT